MLYPARTAVEYVEYDTHTQQVTTTDLTYSQLMSHVRRITAALTQRFNVQRGHAIGVLGPATPDTIAALLAVWCTGAVVAPLEVDNSRAPDLRLTLIVGTAEQLLSAGKLIGDTAQLTLPVTGDDTRDDTSVTRVTNETNDAYIMWTSGTTRAEPTRVTVPHASVLPNLHSLREALQVDSTSALKTILIAPLSFDPSIIDLFLALGYGGTLVLPSPAVKLVPKLFVAAMHAHHVTTLQCTPSFVRRLPPKLRANLFLAPSLQHVILGGEPFPPVSEIRQWLGTARTANGLQMYNIYGITEVSVWATLERVNLPRVLARKAEQYVPPLGSPLGDTALALRTDDNQFVLLAPYLHERGCKRDQTIGVNVTRADVLSGQLLIGSQVRRCRLNDETEPQEWRETGDVVRVVRGKVYYVGRAQDCLVKVHGKRINLLEISTTLRSCPQIREASVLAVDEYGLVCFVETSEPDAVAAVTHFARQHLPPFMRPNHVLVLDTLPLTRNGKLDKTALRDMFRARQAEQSMHPARDRSAVRTLTLQLWRGAVPGIESWSEEQITAQHFVALGASSIDVLACADKLSTCLGLKARVDSAEVKQRMHDALLHFTFAEVVDCLMTLLGTAGGDNEAAPAIDTSAATNEAPRSSTLLGTPLRATSRGGRVTTFVPVLHSRDAVVTARQFSSAALKWKQWLVKCVDASPLVIATAQQQCVVIGSHSGHVTCLELYSGETIWRAQLPDRVESSATLVTVAHQFYVCVGCYDHRVYFLNAIDGRVVWSYALQGQVKSSAVQDLRTELVWIGAHSGVLVALDVRQQKCVMDHQLSAPIFAVPCIDATRQRVYVAVEDHFLYAFNSARFEVEWKLQAPLFSSPVVTVDGVVVVGGVNNVLTAVGVSGAVLWQHKTEGPVFSSPALMAHLGAEYIVCGCHDGHVYCLDVQGALKWRRQLGLKPIFSSAFVGHTAQGDVIAVANTAGEIFVLDATGELLTRVKCLGEVFSSPVLVDSLLLVGCRDDSVHCFEFEG